jgi:dCMP deaminase
MTYDIPCQDNGLEKGEVMNCNLLMSATIPKLVRRHVQTFLPELLPPVKMGKWNTRFCELAKFVSKWSKDPNAQVGAVLHAKAGGDISIGYNGFPSGVEDSINRLHNPDEKLDLIVHAEINALLAAGSRADGATLYVWGKPVCARCAGPVIQAGVRRVVALSPSSVSSKSKWHATGERAYQMFHEAGVEVQFYTVQNDVLMIVPVKPE